MRSIILNIDVGTSKMHCTAYEFRHDQHLSFEQWLLTGRGTDPDHADGREMTWMRSDGGKSLVAPPQLSDAMKVKGVGHTTLLSAIISETGHIRIHEVLKGIDNCIDETLKLLSLNHVSTDPESDYQVVAIGFTTFVMNLVAVDIDGNPVGEAATCSAYACKRDDVVQECQRLRE